MAVHYNIMIVEAMSQVKRLCCAAVNHLFKCEAGGIPKAKLPSHGVQLSHLAGCVGEQAMTSLEQVTDSDTRGYHSEGAEAGVQVPHVEE